MEGDEVIYQLLHWFVLSTNKIEPLFHSTSSLKKAVET